MFDDITSFISDNTTMVIIAAIALIVMLGIFIFKPAMFQKQPSYTHPHMDMMNMPHMMNMSPMSSMSPMPSMPMCDPNTGMCMPPPMMQMPDSQSPPMMQTPDSQMMQMQQEQQQNYDNNNNDNNYNGESN